MPGVSKEPKPMLRGRLHALAFLASIPAAIVLVSGASNYRALFAGLVYAASLTFAFGASAVYHCGTWSTTWTSRMRRLDHVTIFLLIAGTYTPVCLLAIRSDIADWILAAEWIGAVAGILLVIFVFDRTRVITGLMYIIMGWLAVLAHVELGQNLSQAQLVLLFSGGVLYTVGAGIYAAKKPNPWPRVFEHHEIWHTMETAAAGCHWTLVLSIVGVA